jgi:lipopolysaccharide/colanic/teichoic acid biosynthesis glycosyltransferase
MKRLFDLLLSIFSIIILSPIIVIVSILIFIEDRNSPIYIANRVGKHGKLFKMIKFRTMIVDAEKTGVVSTKSGDSRITNLGHIIRQYKLDEIPQLWNVFVGQMTFVGPRPNVKVETDLYSIEEREILNISPGITDFSSIIFSNEGEILQAYANPDLAYNQLIRPWKSRLAIFYILNTNILLDIKLILITILSIIDREKAVKIIVNILKKNNADKMLISVCSNEEKLKPYPPPGFTKIVEKR